MSIPTKMLQSLLETVLEHPLCSQHPYFLDIGSSLCEGHGLKWFYKHLGHGDTKNTHCCDGKKFNFISITEHTSLIYKFRVNILYGFNVLR